MKMFLIEPIESIQMYMVKSHKAIWMIGPINCNVPRASPIVNHVYEMNCNYVFIGWRATKLI
jgi:hypothetical protein